MESEKEDFGPGSRTKAENDELNLYPSELPKCPELNLTKEDNERFKDTWYKWITNRKKE